MSRLTPFFNTAAASQSAQQSQTELTTKPSTFDLDSLDLEQLPLHCLSSQLIHQHKILPLLLHERSLLIGIAEPVGTELLDSIESDTQLKVKTVSVEKNQLLAMIDRLVETPSTDTGWLQTFERELQQLAFEDIPTPHIEMSASVNDTPVVHFVNALIKNAILQKASDIHIEPFENYCRIRYRTDGMLAIVSRSPKAAAGRLISRIKVMANMDIAEHRLPQDGRIKWQFDQHNIDLRVNSCPTLYGEKIVLRILDQSRQQISIDDLGFDSLQQQQFLNALQQPYGMILVTGPTGSGKTVTLYAGLARLNSVSTNISTVEDSVEISLEGINQVNVNHKTGLTFAEALRAFLRQDPDIIMVGEIRDQETAGIAVKAAQTGHLVLSTLHTNNAPETISRLLQIGIEPFNIASALLIIIAQRLVRLLCQHCKQAVSYPAHRLQSAGFSPAEFATLRLYQAQGCPNCHQGYKGRTGIYQVLPISDQMRSIILDAPNALSVDKQAQQEGINNLREAGLNKVRLGITSLEEVERITRE